jgi:hypothetical protein
MRQTEHKPRPRVPWGSLSGNGTERVGGSSQSGSGTVVIEGLGQDEGTTIFSFFPPGLEQWVIDHQHTLFGVPTVSEMFIDSLAFQHSLCKVAFICCSDHCVHPNSETMLFLLTEKTPLRSSYMFLKISFRYQMLIYHEPHGFKQSLEAHLPLKHNKYKGNQNAHVASNLISKHKGAQDNNTEYCS